MSLTIDASVHVSNLHSADVNHADSRAFFGRAISGLEGINGPYLLVIEAAGAIARITRDTALGISAIAGVRAVPGQLLVPLTEARADRAAELASAYFLRGADAAYVQVAEETGSTLVTWDSEMLTRAASVVLTITPTDWLAASPKSS